MCEENDLDGIFNNLKNYIIDNETIQISNVEPCLLFKFNQVHTNIISNNRNKNILRDVEAILDVLWESLNTGHWSLVPENYRRLYGLGSLYKVIQIIQEIINSKSNVFEHLKNAIKAADMGLLMGCGYHEKLSDVAQKLSSLILNEDLYDSSIFWNTTQNKIPGWDFPGIKGNEIAHEQCPSLEYFFKHYFSKKIPVKLKESILHWPAFKKWKDVNYLIRTIGPRMVPIELGSSYAQNDWSMTLSSFEDFFKNYILLKNDSVGYLAQHQLFDQVPELKRDFHIPEYCCLSESESSSCEVDINAWIGPAGTVSPLHYDPKHNLLSQVIGRKRIILYAPEDSEKLYPHGTKMLHNTARVDPYNPDYEQYPEFKKCSAIECHLNPGDMLYIPPKWWHHVRSLDISFSVSFWWE